MPRSSSKKAVDSNDRTDQVSKMEAAGYITATAVISKMGITRTTVHRWAADGEVKSEIVANNMYIELKSLIEHIGEVQAKIFGFVTEKKAGGAK